MSNSVFLCILQLDIASLSQLICCSTLDLLRRYQLQFWMMESHLKLELRMNNVKKNSFSISRLISCCNWKYFDPISQIMFSFPGQQQERRSILDKHRIAIFWVNPCIRWFDAKLSFFFTFWGLHWMSRCESPKFCELQVLFAVICINRVLAKASRIAFSLKVALTHSLTTA